MRAIRIDGNEVLAAIEPGVWHAHLFLDYMQREGLTDEQGDQMLEEGRVEFGEQYWDSKTDTYPFVPFDERRDRGYDKISVLRQIAE